MQNVLDIVNTQNFAWGFILGSMFFGTLGVISKYYDLLFIIRAAEEGTSEKILGKWYKIREVK